MKQSAEKIGTLSMIFLFLNLSLAKHLLVVPSFFTERIGNAAWIAVVLKGIFASLMFLAIAALYKPYSSMGLGELNRRTFGKYFGGALNLSVATIITLRGGFLFRTLSEALRTLEAENASIEFMAVFILLPVALCALKGFNTNANLSILIIPVTVASVAALGAVLFPHFRLDNLMPLLGEGAGEIVSSALLRFSGFFDLLFMLIFSSHLRDYSSFKAAGLWGIGAITAVSALFTAMYCASVPYPASKYFFFPLYELTRLVKAGSFMQRLEPLAVFVWAGTVLCALTTIVLGVGKLVAAAALTKDETALSPLITAMIFLVGALPPTENDVYNTYKFLLNMSHVFYISAIFLTLLVARGRKIEKA